MTQKRPERPHEFEEIHPPNPWPIAIAVSIAIQAVIVLELLLPYRSHLAQQPKRPAMRPAGVYQEAGAGPAPIMRPAPTQKDAAGPAPTPGSHVLMLPAVPTHLDMTPTAPARNPRIEPIPKHAAEPRAASRPVVPAKPARSSAKPAAAPIRVVEPPARTGPGKTRSEPMFDSVGEWLQAMSRMRHGDFAPHRPE